MKKYDKYKDSGVDWFDIIPETWKVIKFKYVTQLMTCGHAATPEYVDENHGVAFLSAQNIKNEKITLTPLKFIKPELHESLTQHNRVEKGDLLQARVGGTSNIGQTAIVEYDLDVSIYVSLSHIKLNNHAYNGFIKYLCNSQLYKEHAWSIMKKGGGVANFNVSDQEKIRIPLPPISEQTKIAQYLDHQTAIIDQLIKQKEKLIELLKEKRQAVINEAVTKGLNPNAKMKDSEIEWLGRVPEEWSVTKLKWIAEIYAGGTPSTNVDEYWTNGTVPWLNSGTVNQKRITEATSLITEDAVKNSSTKWVPKNSLLMALAGQGKTKGTVAILDFDATCNQSMAAIVPDTNEIDTEYLFFWLHSNYERIRGLAGTEQRDGLNLEIVGNIFCPLPSILEQRKLSTYLTRYDMQCDELINKIEMQIDKLKEYRQSIISETVTGKIDVRDWQPDKQNVA